MGSGDSRLYKPPTLKKESWRECRQRRAARPEQGRFRVLANNLTNEELEEYLLSFHSLPEFQRYLEFFQWREREDCIVNSKYLNYERGHDFCNTSYTARVYIERIPVRLSDIEDIPFPENLYLLLSALDGFEKLYRSAGYFRPTEDLICMDRDGRVKAWLHADLSRYLPSGCPPEQAGARREEALEAKMVDEILRMVEDNTARDHEPRVGVAEYMRRNQRARGLTFHQAKQEVIAYAEEFHAEIPNYFESVVGIFDEGAEEEEEQSAQPPPFLRNDRETDDEGHHQEVVQNWQSSHPQQTQAEMVTEQGADYAQERVFAHAPAPEQEDRPSSAVYSLGGPLPAEPAFFPPPPAHQAYPYAPSYPEYRSASAQATASNPNFRVKFNYQPHFQQLPPPPHQLPPPPHQLPPPPQLFPAGYASPLSPISQLATSTPATLVIKKVTSIPEQAEREERREERFDAKLAPSSSLKNLLSHNNKLVYSDSTSTYELDEELAEDMVRYLNGEA